MSDQQAATVETSLEPEPAANLPLSDDGDNDSVISSNFSSASDSIASSVIAYKYENGRRYHAYREGAYAFPNDEKEQSRLDLLHHVYMLALDGKLLSAPISKDVSRVLDFGTGTGIWALDFADEHEKVEVVGTDLSPIQPQWVPPNCKFLVDDVESDWNYREHEAFDIVHSRSMGGSISDWPGLLKQILANLKPGGVCEMQEFEAAFFAMDSTLSEIAPNVAQWESLVVEAGDKFGKKMNIAPDLKQLMLDAGFADVNETIVQVPIGPWAKGRKNKELGIFQREHVCDGVEAYGAFFSRFLGWSSEEMDVLLAKVKKEARDPKLRLYTRFRFVYGFKPVS